MAWRLFSVAAIAVACLTVLVGGARAQSRCIDAAIPKASVAAKGGQWIELIEPQVQFLRGIFAMNPQTAAGLPYGSSAVMATLPDKSGALTFFIDGSLACDAMPIPKELVDLMIDVGSGAISHEPTN